MTCLDRTIIVNAFIGAFLISGITTSGIGEEIDARLTIDNRVNLVITWLQSKPSSETKWDIYTDPATRYMYKDNPNQERVEIKPNDVGILRGIRKMSDSCDYDVTIKFENGQIFRLQQVNLCQVNGIIFQSQNDQIVYSYDALPTNAQNVNYVIENHSCRDIIKIQTRVSGINAKWGLPFGQTDGTAILTIPGSGNSRNGVSPACPVTSSNITEKLVKPDGCHRDMFLTEAYNMYNMEHTSTITIQINDIDLCSIDKLIVGEVKAFGLKGDTTAALWEDDDTKFRTRGYQHNFGHVQIKPVKNNSREEVAQARERCLNYGLLQLLRQYHVEADFPTNMDDKSRQVMEKYLQAWMVDDYESIKMACQQNPFGHYGPI